MSHDQNMAKREDCRGSLTVCQMVNRLERWLDGKKYKFAQGHYQRRTLETILILRKKPIAAL